MAAILGSATHPDSHERCLRAFPAGSNGEFNFPPELATVIDRGMGPMVWDSEGNEYIDFSMGWGSALVGHANERVTAAAGEQMRLGANFACVNTRSLELAERLIEINPACEQLRFCASGTEATHYCGRIARAYTGREKILKFEGAYHGSNDLGVTSLFPDQLKPYPTPERSCHGTTREAAEHILVAPFNDIETTSRILRDHRDDLAAVIVEPLHRCLPPVPGFLQDLRSLCDELGIILIFDEVVTGFRLAFGGAQEYYGVVPDLIAYGKALGGGFPIGVFGGRRELVKVVEEDRLNRGAYVWTASTLGGNPVSCAAAWSALDVLEEPGVYSRLHETGAYLRNALKSTMQDLGVCGQVIGDGPLAQFVFSSDPVTDYRSTRAGDRAKSRRVMLDLIQRGIFLNPMGTKLYISIEHATEHCDRMVDAFRMALIHDRIN